MQRAVGEGRAHIAAHWGHGVALEGPQRGGEPVPCCTYLALGPMNCPSLRPPPSAALSNVLGAASSREQGKEAIMERQTAQPPMKGLREGQQEAAGSVRLGWVFLVPGGWASSLCLPAA